MVTAMILAGGVGSRVGAECPKQFIEVFGKPILAYTIEIYQKNSQVEAIEIVCHEDWIDYLKKMIKKYDLSKVRWITQGGKTFQESVINGMKYLKDKLNMDDIVMIHYGAAPFSSQHIIQDGIEKCKKYGMSVSCTPCFQLMGSNDGNGKSKQWIDRDKQVQICCPQSFRYGYLVDIYERAENNGLLTKIEPHTTSLMYDLGDTVYQSYGNQTNIKITTKEDIKLFEGYVLLKKKEKTESLGNIKLK